MKLSINYLFFFSCLIITLELYCPHSLHTLWLNLSSPQLEQADIPGTSNLICVRRLSRRAFDVLRFGTAILTPPTTNKTFYSLVNQSANPAKRGSSLSSVHSQGSTFKSTPQIAHSPLHASSQIGM